MSTQKEFGYLDSNFLSIVQICILLFADEQHKIVTL